MRLSPSFSQLSALFHAPAQLRAENGQKERGIVEKKDTYENIFFTPTHVVIVLKGSVIDL